jgi:integrase/recombinase XerD
VSELRYLKRAEWGKLVNSIFNLRDSIILGILYETGCTISELVLIKVKDITPTNIQIKERHSVISLQLYTRIQMYFELEGKDKEFLLSSRQSENMTQKRIIQIVRFYSKRMGFEITPQILRYTHIAHAYECNVPVSTIINQVGLKKSRIIQILSEITVGDQAKEYSNFYEKMYQT